MFRLARTSQSKVASARWAADASAARRVQTLAAPTRDWTRKSARAAPASVASRGALGGGRPRGGGGGGGGGGRPARGPPGRGGGPRGGGAASRRRRDRSRRRRRR